MLYVCVRFLAWLLFKIFFGFRCRGREHFPGRGGVIVASNHLSFMDPVALGAAAPRPLHFLARHDLFEANRLFGWFIGSVQAFPIKIKGLDKQGIEEAVRRLKRGNALVVFPEGARSKDGSLGRGRPGIGLLVSLSGVPVIPAFIRGTGNALPVGSKRIRLCPVSVFFGRPMVFQKPGDGETGRRNYQNISDEVMREISQLREQWK